jgi:hypothetical protein
MDIRGTLRELKDMYESGLITAAVYEQKQRELLAASPAAPQFTKHPPSGLEAVLDPKRNLLAIKRLIILAVGVLAAIWLVYVLSGQQTKDSLSQFASETGIGKQVIPWTDRADTAARNLVERNKQGIAEAVQGITHPTGSHASMSKYQVSKLPDRIVIEMTVAWKGGILGGDYATTVVWELNKSSQVGARITFDTAMTNVQPQNAELLSEYFLTKVYPAFVHDVGDAT